MRKGHFISLIPEQDVKTLAIYNAECARGIVHTKAWDEKMTNPQAWFNEDQTRRLTFENGEL